MRTLAWNQRIAAEHVRDRVWRYVTAASTRQDDIVLRAAALLQMSAHDVRGLAQIHFAISQEVRLLLEEMPQLVRRLATTTTTELEVVAGRLRGPVRWGETHAHRRSRGDRRSYVTAPAQRAFDTPENRLLAFVLSAIVEQGRRTRWHRARGGEPGRQVAATVTAAVADATRWLQLAELAELPRTAPSAGEVAAIRLGRNRVRYARVLAAFDLYHRYVRRLDAGAVRRAVEHDALLWRRPDVLLELRCAFDCGDLLRAAGWEAQPDGLLKPPVIFTAARGGDRLEVRFQSLPHELATICGYAGTLRAHGLDHGRLRPDLVLRHEPADGPARWLMVEVKSGIGEGRTLARSTARDLLMYRRAFDAALAGQEGLFGIGYAWGAELRPRQDGGIALCTPDTLAEALGAAGLC